MIFLWMVFYQNQSNRYALLHKMTAKAKNYKPLNDVSSFTPRPISNKPLRIVCWNTSAKIVVTLHCTNCRQSQKFKKKTTNEILSINTRWIWTKRHRTLSGWSFSDIASTILLFCTEWLPEANIFHMFTVHPGERCRAVRVPCMCMWGLDYFSLFFAGFSYSSRNLALYIFIG